MKAVSWYGGFYGRNDEGVIPGGGGALRFFDFVIVFCECDAFAAPGWSGVLAGCDVVAGDDVESKPLERELDLE